MDSELYGMESASDQIQQLAADSDEEMAEEGSDIDSEEDEREIIKIKKKAQAPKAKSSKKAGGKRH